MLQHKVDTWARALEALVAQQEHMLQQLQYNAQNTAVSIAKLSTVMSGSARLQGRHTSVVSPPQLAFGTFPVRARPVIHGQSAGGAAEGTSRRATYPAAGRGATFTAAPTHPHPGLRPTKPIRAAVPHSTR
jgi:hypothetical protein